MNVDTPEPNPLSSPQPSGQEPSPPESGQWLEERKHTIRKLEELPLSIHPLRKERDFFGGTTGLDFAVTPYYLSLIGSGSDQDEPAEAEGITDPIRRQCIPTVDEKRVLPYESSDPLHENEYSPVPRLVHRYRDRALLMVTDECAVYCRHCFRRHFSGGRRGAPGADELRQIAGYLGEHGEVNELLLSGGDPLTLSDERVERILNELRRARPGLVFRLATRMPVVLPSRITSGLAEMLHRFLPMFLVTQFNHPKELTGKSGGAVRLLLDAGVTVLNQAVLLRGVNDDPDILEELFQGLVGMQVFPYYLLQGDLASGTSHFRVPLTRGYEIVVELRKRISGIAMPVYAVDLPGGGGKIPLTESYFLERKRERSGGVFSFTSLEGGVFEYPNET